MRATEKDAAALAALVKIVWSESTEEALVRISLNRDLRRKCYSEKKAA